MNNKLLEKIDKIWLGTKRYNNHTFTKEEIEEMLKTHSSIPLYIWSVKNKNLPKCKCGNDLVLISLIKGFRKLCKECSQKERLQRTRETTFEKYGYKSVFENKEIQQKANEKAKSETSKKKREATKLKNNSFQSSPDVVAKQKETYNNNNKELIISKIKTTKLKEYGNENFNNPNKRKETNLKKFGVEVYSQSTTFKEMFCGLNNSTYNHFHHIENFNDVFIEQTFIKDGIFDILAACDYFKCTWNAFKHKNYYQTSPKIGNGIKSSFLTHFPNMFEVDTKKIIPPLEIDYFNEKISCEYNGLFWHSSLFKNKHYHYNKTIQMEKLGYHLFHIQENEWMDLMKREIWKSMISIKLKLNITTYYGRKCEVKEISTKNYFKEIKQFLEENHIQGYCPYQKAFGLYFNNELVSLMTFGKPRFSKHYQWELLRFCSCKYTQIVGGGSKLLKAFESIYNPQSLISYANRRWSQGNFYLKSGFEFKGETKPNYFYFNSNGKLYSRIVFQKMKLKKYYDENKYNIKYYDENLSEKENMKENGYLHIYDCGNLVFEKKY